MKSLFHTAMAALLLMGFTACESNGGDGEEEEGGIQGPYTLRADKETVEADGKDAITFTLTDASGTVLTEGTPFDYVTIKDVETGTQLTKKTKTFTTIKNGSYTFQASYKKSSATSNTVTVTAQNRNKYEKYFRKVAAYDVTNVYCTYCPKMTEALDKVSEEWGKHMTVFAIHGTFNSKDPFILGNVGSTLLSRFIGQLSYPSCIFNLDASMTGAGDAIPSYIAGVIEQQMRKLPATCGINISSTSYKDGKITIDTKFTSNIGGKYDLGYALLLDNQVYVGGIDTNNKYHDIVIGLSTNYMSMNNETSFTVEADQERTSTFTFDKELTEAMIPNCRIVVFALRPNGNASIIDNVAECKLGESVGYVLNE